MYKYYKLFEADPLEGKMSTKISSFLHIPRTSTLRDQKGQSLIEFMLLLLVVMTISMVLITGIRRGVSGYWKGAALILCNHAQTSTSNCSVIEN
tara:strand:+ start:21173 stop:21454 length:282 start_codon:yes stop_codon:yes gene_type:complete